MGLPAGSPGTRYPLAVFDDRLAVETTGPDISSGDIELVESNARAIFRVPVSLLTGEGDGAAQREAFRRFESSSLAPLGKLISHELSTKLDQAISLSFDEIRATDAASRTRALQQSACAFKTLVDGGVTVERALALTGFDEEG